MALMFGTDFSTTSPANSDAIKDGASSIRDLKTRLLNFVNVMFVNDTGLLKTGTTLAPIIGGMIQNTSDDGQDASRAIGSDHIKTGAVGPTKLHTDASDVNDATRAVTTNAMQNGCVTALKTKPDAHFYGGTSGGSSTAYTVVLSPAPALTVGAPPTGTEISFKVHVANTNTTPALSVDAGAHAFTIVKRQSTALAVGDMLINQVAVVKFDGANWVLLNPAGPANIFNAKAWVNFTGVAIPVLSDNLNVASVTRSATGTYVVTFTTAFTNANYAAVATINDTTAGLSGVRVTAQSALSVTLFVANDPGGSASAASLNPISVSLICIGN